MFDRSAYKPVLTEAGKLLLRDGRRLLCDAHHLEHKLTSLASGWESDFQIVMDEAINFSVFPLIKKFYQKYHNTNLCIRSEVLGGCWDAMLNHSANLAIGVTGLMPDRDDYTLIKIGLLNFDFGELIIKKVMLTRPPAQMTIAYHNYYNRQLPPPPRLFWKKLAFCIKINCNEQHRDEQ